MKNLISIFLFLPTFLFSQEFGFVVNTNGGYIETTYILHDNIVFMITETIDAIYVFNSDSLAKEYLQNLDQGILPRREIQLGETVIFVNSVTSIDYYTNDTPSGSSGQIKSINDLKFTYAPNHSWNINSGVVGFLTQIGDIKIKYWTDAGYTEKGKYRGKIKSFGKKEFKYEGWSSWGEKVGMIGRLNSLGTLKINYYQTDYDTGFKGKLKSIGAVEFIYFRDTYENKKADIVGEFQKRRGEDARLIIH